MQGSPIGLSLVFTDPNSSQTAAAYGYKTIKDSLVTILGQITTIQRVYGKEEKEIKEFPAICVSAKEHSSRYNSVGKGGSNRRQYQHYVRVYFRVDEKNDADYEDVLEAVADQVVQKIESNVTLNGACAYALPETAIWRFGDKQVPVRIFELVVTSTAFVRRDRGTLT